MPNENEKVIPWETDCLNRKIDADSIQQYLDSRYNKNTDDKGFVLALNGDWGSGKTFLLNHWYAQAKNEKRAVIFFDAWKNDFSKEPFLAFIAELDAAVEPLFGTLGLKEVATRTIKEKWDAVKKPAAKLLISVLAKHGAGMASDAVQALFNEQDFDVEEDARSHGKKAITEVSDGLRKLFDNSLKAQKTHKQAMESFKRKLRELVVALQSTDEIKLPIMIFIDELDRCRPTYAIDLLEVIKHLFGVPGVYFVIGTNVKQLSHSVRAVYGESFDGMAYLRRFFDMQYALSQPSIDQFALELMRGVKLPDGKHFRTDSLHLSIPDRFEIENNVSLCAFIFSEFVTIFDLKLRDMQQIRVNLEAAFASVDPDRNGRKGGYNGQVYCSRYIHPFLLIFLAVFYHACPNAFQFAKKHHCIYLSVDSPIYSESISEVEFNKHHLGKLTRSVEFVTVRNSGGELNVFNVVSEYFNAISSVSEPPERVLDFYNYKTDSKYRHKCLDYYFSAVERAAHFMPITS